MPGIIDSDGSVCIKRKKYPQCKISIISGHFQNELETAIKENLNCEANIQPSGHTVESWGGKWYPGFDLDFLVSGKNWKIIKENVLPFITIPRKRIIIEKYLQKFKN